MNASRAVIIANPVKIDLEALRAALPALESRHGYEPSIVLETTPEKDGDELAREALDKGADLVVAAGGDGTVRLAAGELAGSGVPLGIVPAGTGNLLSRNLDFTPTDPLETHLAVAFGGRTRSIDLGTAIVERPDGKQERFPFAVIAGVGVDAGMIEHTDDDLKAKIGWLAYFGGIFRTLAGGANFRARFRVNRGRTFGTRASGFMVGNCGMLQGGMHLLPDAEPDDGILDLVIMRPSGPLGWLEVFTGMITGSVARGAPRQVRKQLRRGVRRALNYRQGDDIVLRIDSRPEPFEVDGDAVGEIVAAHITVREGVLQVRVA